MHCLWDAQKATELSELMIFSKYSFFILRLFEFEARQYFFLKKKAEVGLVHVSRGSHMHLMPGYSLEQ